MTLLLDRYRSEIIPQLTEKRGYKNIHEVPRLVKIVISCGVGSNKERDFFDECIRTVSELSGQKPVIAKSKVDVAGFKLRKGANVGVFVTLRGQRMYDFFMRLVSIALPRVRDFRGLSPRAFDGRGNYTLGITDQTIFTEVNLDKMKHAVGMNITIVTSAKTNEEAFELLSLMGVPFITK